ncbi:hypothetical protein XA68_15427 [Ophiocordyceps unilateralis]|uniref:Uncharacterized protein n=1 Tax=Ophiocordyceps unilateralis TaxID=268505 RepID=A0A2A9P891_OPHUN|nr:hypothetical protein XA68_15427 [Ophiocordyceps unilateralis]
MSSHSKAAASSLLAAVGAHATTTSVPLAGDGSIHASAVSTVADQRRARNRLAQRKHRSLLRSRQVNEQHGECAAAPKGKGRDLTDEHNAMVLSDGNPSLNSNHAPFSQSATVDEALDRPDEEYADTRLKRCQDAEFPMDWMDMNRLRDTMSSSSSDDFDVHAALHGPKLLPTSTGNREALSKADGSTGSTIDAILPGPDGRDGRVVEFVNSIGLDPMNSLGKQYCTTDFDQLHAAANHGHYLSKLPMQRQPPGHQAQLRGMHLSPCNQVYLQEISALFQHTSRSSTAEVRKRLFLVDIITQLLKDETTECIWKDDEKYLKKQIPQAWSMLEQMARGAGLQDPAVSQAICVFFYLLRVPVR